MYDEVLKNKLKTLYTDLTVTGPKAVGVLGLLSDSVEDRSSIVRDLYFCDHSPVKVLNTQFKPRGKSDWTGEMIEVSMGFDDYIVNLTNEAQSLMDRHSRALRIFIVMMSLPMPFSQILYLKFFKCLTTEQVCEIMFLSKSGYYRKLEQALGLLAEALDGKSEVVNF